MLLIGVMVGSASSLTGCAPATKSYNDVIQLREAYISAGGERSQWEKSEADETDLAFSRGVCSDSNVMAVFPSEAATQQKIKNTDRNLGEVFKLDRLVGPNWEITNDISVLAELQKTMGGTITVFGKGVKGVETT